jgi:F-type H+-transporting ATPase subunit epsilon
LASKTFQLTVLSAEKQLYSGSAESLTLPTDTGEVTVLSDHIGLVSNLHAGELIIRNAGKTEELFVGGGVLEFSPENQCRVLADVAERVAEIDAAKAEVARKAAQTELENAKSEPEVASAKAALFKAIARIRIAEKHRKKYHR